MDVLPGLLSKDIKSSPVDFYCDLDGCNSDGSYCIYKFQIKISTTDVTTSKPVSPKNELNNTKQQDEDTVINIDETRPKVLTPQKRAERINLKEIILEESNADLSDGHFDDHSDESSGSNGLPDPVTNNDKPTASFSETLRKETGIRKDTLNDLGWLYFLRLCLLYEANIKLLQRPDGKWYMASIKRKCKSS